MFLHYNFYRSNNTGGHRIFCHENLIFSQKIFYKHFLYKKTSALRIQIHTRKYVTCNVHQIILFKNVFPKLTKHLYETDVKLCQVNFFQKRLIIIIIIGEWRC